MRSRAITTLYSLRIIEPCSATAGGHRSRGVSGYSVRPKHGKKFPAETELKDAHDRSMPFIRRSTVELSDHVLIYSGAYTYAKVRTQVFTPVRAACVGPPVAGRAVDAAWKITMHAGPCAPLSSSIAAFVGNREGPFFFCSLTGKSHGDYLIDYFAGSMHKCT